MKCFRCENKACISVIAYMTTVFHYCKKCYVKDYPSDWKKYCDYFR